MSHTRDSIHFFRTFLRDPRRVGAVLPSSRRLARELAGDLHLERGDVIVEYGPGTGPTTAIIAEQLTDGVEFIAIERDMGFHHCLRKRFPQLRVHHGSAEDVVDILAEHGLARPRYIISGLPFASLPAGVQHGIIEGTREALRPDGEFRTFQYVHAYGLPAARRFRKLMRGEFSHFDRSPPIMRNTPPAFVLRYQP